MLKKQSNALMNYKGEDNLYRTSSYTVYDPCIPENGFPFIWMSIINCLQVQKVCGSAPSEEQVKAKEMRFKRSNSYPRELWMKQK